MNTLDEHELRLAAEALHEKADQLEQSGKPWEAKKYRSTAEKITKIVEERETTWIENYFRKERSA